MLSGAYLKIPNVDNNPLDFYFLYSRVIALGGFQKMASDGLWSQVAKEYISVSVRAQKGSLRCLDMLESIDSCRVLTTDFLAHAPGFWVFPWQPRKDYRYLQNFVQLFLPY